MPIPVTEMRSLFKTFKLLTSLGSHLAMAKETQRDKQPLILARMFEASVRHFSRYNNVYEPFYPE